MNTAKYVFKLTEAVASLLRKALSKKDEEESRYYAGELRRIGSLFFEQSETVVPPTQPQAISVGSVEQETKVKKQEAEISKKEKRERRRYNLRKLLSSKERLLLSAVLLSENMPGDRDELARVVYPDTLDNMPSRNRKILFARSIQTLGFGLAKLRFILKTGSYGEADRDFLESVRGRYPDITVEQFERTAAEIFKKYDVKIPAVWVWEETDNENNKAKPYTNRRQKARPISEWSQILYAAFFHPDGPSLDPSVVSKRTQIEPSLAEPMLSGALETIELEWSGNGKNDRQAQELIRMLHDKWPSKSFAEIIAACKEE